ncbi:MAG: GDP-mannose 4,6-dehydratase, partial [Nitrospirota bacterium]
ENIREWLFFSDCADAGFEVLERGKAGEIYNIGSGQEKRNIDLVKTVLNILGKPEELIEFVADRPGHDFRYSLSSDKIRADLGWSAKTSFPEGIEKTVRWYLDNMEWARSKINTK